MIKYKPQLIEDELDLSEITLRHGVHSFRYGTSSYLTEIFDFLNLTSSDIFYDLGSGYGIVLNYGAKRFPETLFIGVEILEERFLYSRKVKQKEQIGNVSFYNSDMFDFDFSNGTVFYIFNPLFSSMYSQLLEKLKMIARKREIIIIAEFKCDCFDQSTWLTQYHEINNSILEKVCFYQSNL